MTPIVVIQSRVGSGNSHSPVSGFTYGMASISYEETRKGAIGIGGSAHGVTSLGEHVYSTSQEVVVGFAGD